MTEKSKSGWIMVALAGVIVAVIGGIWTALNYPWAFVAFLIVFVLLLIWLLPKLWIGIKKVFGFIGRLFGAKETVEPGTVEEPGPGK